MTIKEVEKELEVPRATIRFYEKKNLLEPVRGENSYRDYSDEDVIRLKKIIIFRKIGLSVLEIEEVLNEKVSLSEVIEDNIIKIKEQMDELNGALHISKKMKENKEELKDFDQNFYWSVIHKEEKIGNKFMNIVNDTLEYEKKIVFEEFQIVNSDGDFLYGKKESIMRAASICIAMGICNYFIKNKELIDFLKGAAIPFIWIVIDSLGGMCTYYIRKKYNIKHIRIIQRVVGVIILLLIIAIIKRY